VQPARFKEQFEAVVIEVYQFPAQRPGEFAATQAVIVVPILVHSTGVVEQGEQGHDFLIRAVGRRDSKPVLKYPRPMNNTV
jgi:hypothetical protein